MNLNNREKRYLVAQALLEIKEERYRSKNEEFLHYNSRTAGDLALTPKTPGFLKKFMDNELMQKIVLGPLERIIPNNSNYHMWLAGIFAAAVTYAVYKGLQHFQNFEVTAVSTTNRPTAVYDAEGNPIYPPILAKLDFHKKVDLKIGIAAIAYISGVDSNIIMKVLMLNERAIVDWIKKTMGAPASGGRGRHTSTFDPNDITGFLEDHKEDTGFGFDDDESIQEKILLSSIGEHGGFPGAERGRDVDKYEISFDFRRFGKLQIWLQNYVLNISYSSTFGIDLKTKSGEKLTDSPPVPTTQEDEAFADFDF